MCRLLGYVCTEPTAVRDLMGTTAFEEWTSLSRVHADGWGMAWSDGRRVRRKAAPTCADDDPDFAGLVARSLARSGLVHLRWATDGLAVDAANTHPFLDGDVALAHNGSITPLADLDRMVGGSITLHGTTDSERYFGLIRRQLTLDPDLVTATRSVVERLLGSFRQASLNALILSPDLLLAVHASRDARVPLADLEVMFPGFEGAPPDHVDAYFQLRYLRRDDVVLITSSGVEGGGWIDIPHNAMLVVDRATREVTTIPLTASWVTDTTGDLAMEP